ncbi:hypothetical protein ACFW91_31035 [Streptomyces asoensis]|uniref:hypothetical protein n=1 Tax=Streptomyces asoensis TaxID=249586 RepID=UPI0036C720CB
MTDETPDARSGIHLDPSVAAQIAVAEDHLASHLPLLTAEAKTAMLARIRAAAQVRPTPAVTATVTATGAATATSSTTGALTPAARSRGRVAADSPGAGTVGVMVHRRATAFARALEETRRDPHGEGADAPHPERAGDDTEQSRLLALASGLGSLPSPALDPEVKVVQRAQLVAAVEQMLHEGSLADPAVPVVPEQCARRRSARGRVRGPGRGGRPGPAASPRRRSRFGRTLAALALVMAVGFGAFGGLAASSTDALPGDALYGVKLRAEDWRLDMADGDTERGAFHLEFASTRLVELRELEEDIARQNARAGRSGPVDGDAYGDDLRQVLLRLLRETTAGRDLLVGEYRRTGSQAPITVLTVFSRTHRGEWARVRDRLPARLEGMAGEVSVAFDSIERTSRALREPPAPAAGPSPALFPGSAEEEDPGGGARGSAET